MKTQYSKFFLPATVFMLFSQISSAAIIVDNSGAGPVCNTNEVSLSGNNSSACAGYFSNLANANPATENTKLNNVTDGDDWTFVYKVEQGETEGSGEFQSSIGLSLTNVSIGDESGGWTLNWSDTNGTDPLNLPLWLDIAVGFKAGSGSSGAGIAYFLFDDLLLTDDPFQLSGTFDLIVDKGLSHESLFVRLGTEPTTPPDAPNDQVPEPTSLMLMAFGLLGFFAASRKKA